MNVWQMILNKAFKRIRSWRWARPHWPLRRVLICLAGGLVLVELCGSYLAYRGGVTAAVAAVPQKARTAADLQAANERLLKKIAGQKPAGEYLVIDTARNRVTLRKGDVVLRDMTASCGSGNVLEDPTSGRRWVFDTPRGQHRILSKVKNPLWIKPDWAFLEAGEPIPSKSAERAEPGAMGDYALGLGQGYFIHGTLYKRMLGRNVSHGCVRLGDEDLAHLYRNLPIGTRVFIF
jgi:lipoprotein-anchoring transpeptidase ErfK/SrfK